MGGEEVKKSRVQGIGRIICVDIEVELKNVLQYNKSQNLQELKGKNDMERGC